MRKPLAPARSVIGLAAHLGRGVGRVATDAIVGSRARLPRAVADLSAGVLSDVMGTEVASMSVLTADAGTSTRARLALTGYGVPPTAFVKLAAQTLYTPSADVTSLLTGSMMNTSIKRLRGRTDIPVERGRFIADNYRAVAALIDAAPHTVMHGDAHLGNVYFRDGRPGLLDWQAVRRGHPSRELAYTLVTSLTPPDRRAAERELLDQYRLALAGHRRTRHWRRRTVAALPAGCAVCVCGGSDHRRDGRYAGRRHRLGGFAARRHSAG